MSSMAISLIVFAVVFGGALLGMALRALLPEHHLSQDSKDVVKLGMGLIGTMAPLIDRVGGPLRLSSQPPGPGSLRTFIFIRTSVN